MRARKAIYGLKQAGRNWGQDLHKILTKLGMRRAESEPCLYIRDNQGKIIKLTTHVDDCFCTFNDRAEYDEFKQALEEVLRKMSNSDKPVLSAQDDNDRYLGIIVQRIEPGSRDPISVPAGDMAEADIQEHEWGTGGESRVIYRLHQKQYIIDILSYFNMMDCKPAPTPFMDKMISAEDNAQGDEKQMQFMQDKNVRKLVGMLLHLARCTRPDIMSAVAILASY